MPFSRDSREVIYSRCRVVVSVSTVHVHGAYRRKVYYTCRKKADVHIQSRTVNYNFYYGKKTLEYLCIFIIIIIIIMTGYPPPPPPLSPPSSPSLLPPPSSVLPSSPSPLPPPPYSPLLSPSLPPPFLCTDIRERFHYVILLMLVSVRNMAQLNWDLGVYYYCPCDNVMYNIIIYNVIDMKDNAR